MAARATPVHSLGVRGRAAAAEVERCGARGRCRVAVGIGLADQAVDQYEPVAAVRLVEGFPVSAVPAGLSASGMLAGEREILEERDVVVLAADRACGDRQVVRSVARIHCDGSRPSRSAAIVRFFPPLETTLPPHRSPVRIRGSLVATTGGRRHVRPLQASAKPESPLP